jgi:hypothetical protein
MHLAIQAAAAGHSAGGVRRERTPRKSFGNSTKGSLSESLDEIY